MTKDETHCRVKEYKLEYVSKAHRVLSGLIKPWLTRSPVVWPDKCSARAGYLTLLYNRTSPWCLKQFLWWADTTQQTDAPTGRSSKLAYSKINTQNGQENDRLAVYFNLNYLFRFNTTVFLQKTCKSCSCMVQPMHMWAHTVTTYSKISLCRRKIMCQDRISKTSVNSHE